MIKINLLPKELQDRGKGADWVFLGYGLIIFVAFIGALMYGIEFHSYKKNMTKKEIWSQQLASIRARVQKVEELDAQKNSLRAKKTAVLQLFEGRLAYPRLFASFYDTLPKEIWVSDLTIGEDAQKKFKLTVISNATTTDGIADWIQKFESNPKRYSDISLSAIDAKLNTQTNQPESYGFSVSVVFHEDQDPG